MLLTLTREDVFNAAVQGCAPSSIAIERMFMEQTNHLVHAVQVTPNLAHVYTMSVMMPIRMPPPLSTFNAAYYHGEITTLDHEISAEV